ncbi:carboxylic ester hydrolase [Longispora fulva]|nr:carboxylic ester hydrolase [Longispora fulva]
MVTTHSGPVRGTVTDMVRTFQGVPYAAPPVGPLRWTAPRPAASWTATRDATLPGAACAQPPGLPVGRPSTEEDCLFLNVTTPRNARKVPVMVWMHGGDLAYGAGDIYGAARLAARGDVVVVTVNYRLGAFGFLAHPALGDGNYGLQDQQAALRWVRANAGAFGGDPRNVTLFGESAGGFSTCSHLASPASAGLFDRVIIQSAPCAADIAVPRAEGEARGTALATSVGCTDPATVAACLRGKATTALLDFPAPRPTIGGALLPLGASEALRTGTFNRVPVLIGVNHDEERLMVAGAELFPGAHPLTREEYPERVRATFGADADRVLATYPLGAQDSPGQRLATILTDHNWSVPALDTDKLLARHVPTYAYEFAERDNPWFAGAPSPSFPVGAAHVSELAYLFDATYAEPLTPAQRHFGDEMIGHWSRFAHTGTADWPRFTGQQGYVRSLASTGPHRADFARDHRYDFWTCLDR